jgi:transcriptional regulator with XRE-family HTH domain
MMMQTATTYAAVLGRVLVARREDHNWDQGDFARMLDLSQSAWSRIERGEAILSFDQLIKAAENLKTPPSEIVAEVERIAARLRTEGIAVQTGRAIPSETSGLALIAAAALGAVIGALLAK